MKACIFGILGLVSLSAIAQSIPEKLDRLQKAMNNGDIDRLSRQEKEVVNAGLDSALSVLRFDSRRNDGNNRNDNRNGGGGEWRRNASY